MKKVLLFLAIFCGTLMASATDFTIDGITYTITASPGDTHTVLVKSGPCSEFVEIPATVTYGDVTYDVKSIGVESFLNCTELTSVTIAEGVEIIAVSAFQGCTGLTSVTIPGSVTSIGNMAFDGCVSLNSVAIPGGVTKIGNAAFRGCTNLNSITFSNAMMSIANDAFDGCSNVTIYVPVASYENYKSQFSGIKVEVPMDIFKPYALNTIEAGLDALNTLSDEDRKFINEYLSDITTAVTFDAAYAPFTNAMSIINDQSNLEKSLKTAIGNLATRQTGPTIEIRAKDGTTIKLYNIEKVNFGKESKEE